MSGLQGIRVLELSRMLPGSYCTMMLADLGADVLKVEEPCVGDPARAHSEFAPMAGDESVIFLTVNRNKRSMTVDLRSEQGRQIVYRLIQDYDVVTESFRPSVAQKLGLSYSQLREINPRVIQCSITGFGHTGPYASHPAHDLSFLAYSGILNLMGPPSRPPTIPSLQISLFAGSTLAAVAILSAIIARQQTGEGQHIDTAMFDSVLSWTVFHSGTYLGAGQLPRTGETFITGCAPAYNVYQTKDGRYFTLSISEPKFWINLCEALGREDLLDSGFGKGAKAGAVKAELQEIFSTKTLDEWAKLLQNEHHCFAPVYNSAEVFADPQVLNRGMLIELDHPGGGKIRDVGSPLKLSKSPVQYRRRAPRLGEHTEEVMAELGYSASEIAKLRNDRAI